MDGGRDCSRQSSAFPPSLAVRSVATGATAWMQEVEQRREQLPRELGATKRFIRFRQSVVCISSVRVEVA
ncbi:MAG: hypothetical protein Q8L15_21550 [Methylobacter sp.]|nr:hypothetical protein [Methylobacter sp.]